MERVANVFGQPYFREMTEVGLGPRTPAAHRRIVMAINSRGQAPAASARSLAGASRWFPSMGIRGAHRNIQAPGGGRPILWE